MRLRDLLSFLILSTSALPAFAIIGGSVIGAQDFKSSSMASSTVAVIWEVDQDGRDISCTGTLIARDLVLTAAHCLTDAKNASEIQIDFLTPNFIDSLGLPKILAKKFVIHENFLKSSDNQRDDLALILLSQAAPAGTTVATLVPANWTPGYIETNTALGYGVSDDRPEMALDDKNGSGILRLVALPDLLPLAQNNSGISGMLAVSQPQSGICHGDSGGPLFVQSSFMSQPLLAGVTHSVVPADGQEKTHLCSGYSYFVNVADQLNWISTQTANLRAADAQK